jgi:hypothetical protein
MIDEAVAAGVVSKKIIKESMNPNKWEKHLAPWFDNDCKIAKSQCK